MGEWCVEGDTCRAFDVAALGIDNDFKCEGRQVYGFSGFVFPLSSISIMQELYLGQSLAFSSIF